MPCRCQIHQRLLDETWTRSAVTYLTDDVKTFIVRTLAAFDTPSQVARLVKAEYGIDVSRQQVEVYDPGSHRPRAAGGEAGRAEGGRQVEREAADSLYPDPCL